MDKHFKSIVVPVDGSEASCRAAAFAAELAQLADVEVCLLHVFSPLPSEVLGMVGLDRAQVEAIGRESGGEAFKQARRSMENPVSVVEHVVWGDPREDILVEADKRDALIVMGRRGLGKVPGLLLGSVSTAVLQTAKRPVTLVN
jgi:nucleotide-binding universal stress UspA family protein